MASPTSPYPYPSPVSVTSSSTPGHAISPTATFVKQGLALLATTDVLKVRERDLHVAVTKSRRMHSLAEALRSAEATSKGLAKGEAKLLGLAIGVEEIHHEALAMLREANQYKAACRRAYLAAASIRDMAFQASRIRGLFAILQEQGMGDGEFDIFRVLHDAEPTVLTREVLLQTLVASSSTPSSLPR